MASYFLRYNNINNVFIKNSKRIKIGDTAFLFCESLKSAWFSAHSKNYNISDYTSTLQYLTKKHRFGMPIYFNDETFKSIVQ